MAALAPQRVGASFSIGAFDVDSPRNALRLADETFPVEPLVMDVLCYLSEHAGEVVAREDIISHVWYFNPGADECLTRAVSLLRQIFRRDESGQAYIETIWKRGYTLLAEVRQPRTQRAVLAGAESLATALNLDTEYSVAVLPFQNLSPRTEDAFLADGVTRDLTMLLSRVSRLRVSAYSSAARIDERKTPLPEISQHLGVRYIVAGSLTRHGDSFQVRAALMDAFDDAQIWAQRLDAPLEALFDIEYKLVLDISTSIVSALQMSFCAMIQGRRPFQLSAYELVQRAESLRLRYNRDTAMEIVGLLDRALAIDPNDGAVHAALAIQHAQNVVSHFDSTPEETFSRARQHVETALSLAPQDPDVLAAAGIAAAMMGNARLAVRKLRQSVALDPNNPHNLAVLGWQQCWLNGDSAGLKMITTAELRAPHHPRFAVWAHYRGHCEIRLGRVAAAIAAYWEGVERNPHYSLNLVTLAAALAVSGDHDQARKIIDRVHQIAPNYSLAEYQNLARRMIYWFGEDPNRDQMLAAMREVWPQGKA